MAHETRGNYELDDKVQGERLKFTLEVEMCSASFTAANRCVLDDQIRVAVLLAMLLQVAIENNSSGASNSRREKRTANIEIEQEKVR